MEEADSKQNVLTILSSVGGVLLLISELLPFTRFRANGVFHAIIEISVDVVSKYYLRESGEELPFHVERPLLSSEEQIFSASYSSIDHSDPSPQMTIGRVRAKPITISSTTPAVLCISTEVQTDEEKDVVSRVLSDIRFEKFDTKLAKLENSVNTISTSLARDVSLPTRDKNELRYIINYIRQYYPRHEIKIDSLMEQNQTLLKSLGYEISQESSFFYVRW
jgi:hypothetical protein